MNNIRFFTPIRYEHCDSCTSWLEEAVDDYFSYLSREEAVINITKYYGEGLISFTIQVSMKKLEKASNWITILKVISCFTIIIPLVVICLKCVFRFLVHEFQYKPQPRVTFSFLYTPPNVPNIVE